MVLQVFALSYFCVVYQESTPPTCHACNMPSYASIFKPVSSSIIINWMNKVSLPDRVNGGYNIWLIQTHCTCFAAQNIYRRTLIEPYHFSTLYSFCYSCSCHRTPPYTQTYTQVGSVSEQVRSFCVGLPACLCVHVCMCTIINEYFCIYQCVSMCLYLCISECVYICAYNTFICVPLSVAIMPPYKYIMSHDMVYIMPSLHLEHLLLGHAVNM